MVADLVSPCGDQESCSDFFLTPPEDRHVSTNATASTVPPTSPLTDERGHGVSWHNQTAGGGTALARTSIWKNNSAQDHMKYVPPTMPKPPENIGDPTFVETRVAYRMTLRPDRNKYVTLNFRVMRHDAEMHVGQIVNLCNVRRTDLYTPRILDRWTVKLQIKLKASVKVSVVFKSISARLGLQNTVGIKYCLDGFYGIEAFGDAFGNFGAGICPWMEVTGEGSPISLHLEDSDNIYVNVVNEKMTELARLRAQQLSEQTFKQSLIRASLMQPSVSVRADRPSAASLASNSPFNKKTRPSQDSEIVELVL